MEESYAEVPGDVVFYQDFKHSNALTYHFIIRANPSNLQRLCDNWLNVSWQSKFRFSPLGPFLLISFVNSSCRLGCCERFQWTSNGCGTLNCSRSLLQDAKGAPLGYFKFNLLSINMLVSGMGRNPMLFSPYTFCDDGTVTANYRELLGWNLLYAKLDFPLVPYGEDPGQFNFSCAMDVPRTQTYDYQPPLETFVDLNREFAMAGESSPTFTRDTQALASMTPYLYERFMAFYGEGFPKIASALSQAMLGNLSRVTLRQFRGTLTGEKAICQSIQSFASEDIKFKDGGVLPLGYTMRFPKISDVAQLHFPLRQDMGLEEEQPVIAGFWTLSDYVNLPHATNWSGIKRK